MMESELSTRRPLHPSSPSSTFKKCLKTLRTEKRGQEIMDLCEIQETIKKKVTVIKKTIIRPFDFDVIVKVPKKNVEKPGRYEDEKEY